MDGMKWHTLLALLAAHFLDFCCGMSADMKDCTDRFPIGLASGIIPSQRLSTSTTFNSSDNFQHYGASQARLGIASFWCGSDKATWQEDWLQIAFSDIVNVTGIAVERGWHSNPYGILEEFYMQFSSEGVTFQNQTNKNGEIINHKLKTGSLHTEYIWFDVIAAKAVRIRASRLLVTSSSSRFCGRFEIYGCNLSKQFNEFYATGLERSIIPDSQITASSSMPHNPPYHARLKFPNSWCPATNKDEWLQIDLGQNLLVKGIASQGHYGRLSTDMVSEYLVSFSNSSTGPFIFMQDGLQNKTFIGNNQTSEDPVFNLIEAKVVARYIRIHPTAGYNGRKTGKICMRVEIYASYSGCDASLTYPTETKMYTVSNGIVSPTSSRVDIYSNISWCAHQPFGSSADSNALRIDLGDIYLVSGIAIAGNLYADSWVTMFDVNHGLLLDDMDVLGKGYIGSNSRVQVTVNWLKSPKVMKYLDIIPKEFVGNRCLRIRVLGCSLVPSTSHVPVLISITPSSNHVSFQAQTSGIPAIKGILVKYFCFGASKSLNCSIVVSRVISSREIQGGEFNITDLQPWTKYQITFSYIFNGSQSLESNATNITTLETKPTQAPGSCNITSVNSTSISLTWVHLPTNASKGVITGYQITLRNGSSNASFSHVATVIMTTYSITGLPSNSAYNIRISAVNKAGSGPPCVLDAQTLSKGVSVAGKGSSKDLFSLNSAIALISCSVGVMLLVVTCILTKASCEKMKHRKGRQNCKRHLKMIKNKTLIDFLESTEKKVDNSIASDSDKLYRIVRESKTSRKSLHTSAVADGRSQYFENLSIAAQSSSGRGRIPKGDRKIRSAADFDELERDEQKRKIGFDNSAFGSLGLNKK